jgi:hypothetical protein
MWATLAAEATSTSIVSADEKVGVVAESAADLNAALVACVGDVSSVLKSIFHFLFFYLFRLIPFIFRKSIS